MGIELRITNVLEKPIVMLGMMGCGKSYVSEVLAQKYGLDHYEMDAMIEAEQGMSISDIFEKHGEAYFRSLETTLLMDLLKNKGACVISSGGGVVEKAENMEAILDMAVSVWLKTDVPVLLERVRGGEERPMLLQGNDPAEELERLLNAREGLYSKADIHIENNGDGSVEELADQIIEEVIMAQETKKPKIVHVNLGERSYDIVIGSGLLSSVQDYLPFDIKGKKLFIITDENVQGCGYPEQIHKAFQNNGARWSDIKVMPAGEATKSYDRLIEALDWMLGNDLNRDSIVVAVGGGVIGDLGGLAASLAMRGVPYVQVPTSLLAQVDSSVGGKTAIDTPYGKNLVGTFYQPVSVIIDTDTLKTLPEREIYAGYGEVVKYGFIGDKKFFEWLEDGNGKKVLSQEPEATARAIEVCCTNKAQIVEADEHEKGQRALLNFGHTFAHAFETLAGYDGKLLHGEAVSIGLVLAFDLSVRMGLCPVEDYERVVAHFRDVGLPVNIHDIDAQVADAIISNKQALRDVMFRDKKVKDGKMVFVLANSIGDSLVHKDVPDELVNEVLEDFLNWGR